MPRKYTLIDLFSGAGGFALGFHTMGKYSILLAIDSYPAAARTYKANFPETQVLNEDIKNVRSTDIQRLAGDIDVIIGSPPCEPFTGANPRRERNPLDRLYRDPMGQLTLHFIRLVANLRPRVFVMENVPAIMDGPLAWALKREFRSAGYEKIHFNILEAERYGTPSHRRRVFVSNILIKPPPINKKITVETALSDLPPPGPFPPNHEPPPVPRKKLKRIARLKWGQAMIHYRGAQRFLPNLIRLDPRKIAPTVLGSSRFIHPYENRFLTVREQARLMGFPDNFVFYGGRDEQYNLVGEAVPPPLSRAIAETVARYLDTT